MNINNFQDLPDFINFLKVRLNEPLPGFEAHKLMQPLIDNKNFRSLIPKHDTTPSAVLVLLTNNNDTDEFEVLLTLRTNNIRHSGQISCPGGFTEKGEGPAVTALREAYEEIGLAQEKILIIGNLSDLYVQPSNTLITPVLSYTGNVSELKVNKDEVQEVFFIKLNSLLDNNVLKKEIWNLKGNDVEVPFWDVHPTTPLWGATSMILKELLLLYEEYLKYKSN